MLPVESIEIFPADKSVEPIVHPPIVPDVEVMEPVRVAEVAVKLPEEST